MQSFLLRVVSAALILAGLVLIWSGHGWIGCGVMVCGGALAGVSQAGEEAGLGRVCGILGGFLLFMAGGYLVYSGRTASGIAVTLLAFFPWCLPLGPARKVSFWDRFFVFACFAFWTFGTAFLFRGQALVGALLLGGSIIPWYAREHVRGRRLILSLTLLGEVAAVCAAAAALTQECFALAAVLFAFFLISRFLDDYLLVRKGYVLAEGEPTLSFRAYLDLDRDEARRLRALGCRE